MSLLIPWHQWVLEAAACLGQALRVVVYLGFDEVVYKTQEQQSQFHAIGCAGSHIKGFELFL
nr:hypothetical protein [uncultured Pseudomonas sp.]